MSPSSAWNKKRMNKEQNRKTPGTAFHETQTWNNLHSVPLRQSFISTSGIFECVLTNAVKVCYYFELVYNIWHYLGELCIYPFGECFLLYCVMLICGIERREIVRRVSRSIKNWSLAVGTVSLMITAKNIVCSIGLFQEPTGLEHWLANGDYSWRRCSLKAPWSMWLEH